MISKARQWGIAFQIVNKDNNAEVPCPACEKGILQIDDVLDEAGAIYQRGLVCPQCGEKRYLLTAFGIFDEFIEEFKASGDDSMKIIETDTSVSIQFGSTKRSDA